MSFYIIFSNKDSFIALKNVFGFITPTPNFWHWLGKLYRIGWCSDQTRPDGRPRWQTINRWPTSTCSADYRGPREGDRDFYFGKLRDIEVQLQWDLSFLKKCWPCSTVARLLSYRRLCHQRFSHRHLSHKTFVKSRF
jgi:hypothetical protein